MINYSLLNKKTYDIVAKEYEERAGILQPITEEALAYFAPYVKPKGKILDVGCAVGIAMNILSKKDFQVTGIEISPKMAAFARKRNPKAKIIAGDFLKADFYDKFDGVLCFAFIHLFPKKQIPVIFDKIKSVLNKGGVAFLSSTQSSENREGWYSKEDFNKQAKRFRKFWTERELSESIDRAGFKRLALKKFIDPYGKIWMDFIVRKM